MNRQSLSSPAIRRSINAVRNLQPRDRWLPIMAALAFLAGLLVVTPDLSSQERLQGELTQRLVSARDEFLPSQDSNRFENNQLTLYRCTVFPKRIIELPAREAGPLIYLGVEPGSATSADAVVAKIDDREAQLQKLAAETKLQASVREAENEISIKEAEAALKVAKSDLARKQSLLDRGSGNSVDVEHSRLAADHAALALQEAEFNREIAILKAQNDEKAVTAANAMIERHMIISPIAGQVYQVLKDIGEWVDIGEPCVEIYQLDRLRIEGMIDSSKFNREDVLGRRVTVLVERAHGKQEILHGQIVNVDLRQYQVGVGRYRFQVHAEVENRHVNGIWILTPGSQTEMTIHFE